MSQSEPLRESLRFLRVALRNPREVGAMFPSSKELGRAMARSAAKANGRPVLELGPGTGSITQAILEAGVSPKMLVAVERSTELIPELQRRFPGVHFIGGDAFQIDVLLRRAFPKWLGEFGCVVSGLPLLNFPASACDDLLEQLTLWVHADAPIVQFSYSLGRSKRFRGLEPMSSKVVWRNLPPARVSEFALGRKKSTQRNGGHPEQKKSN